MQHNERNDVFRVVPSVPLKTILCCMGRRFQSELDAEISPHQKSKGAGANGVDFNCYVCVSH